MDSSRFAEELESWMRDSGKMRELRTKLRADLVEAIRGNKKTGKTGSSSPSSSSSPASRALNSLFLEHLARHRLWYTASVFSSEADFLLEANVTFRGDATADAVEPKLSDEDVARLLTALDLPRLLDSEGLRVEYYRRREASLMESLLRLVNRRGGGGGGLMERLDEIENLVREREEGQRLARKVDRLRRRLDRRTKSWTPSPEDQDDDKEERSTSQSQATQIPDASRSEQEEEEVSVKSNEVKELRSLLDQAREEVAALKEREKGREEELKKALEAQRKLLEERAMESSQAIPRDETGLGSFVSDVRTRVDLLYRSSASIDKELSQL